MGSAQATIPRLCHTRIETTATKKVRIRTGGTNYIALLASGNYFHRGDDETTDTQAKDSLKWLEDALNAALDEATGLVGHGQTFAVAFAAHSGASEGKITISCGASFEIHHQSYGSADKYSLASFGFAVAADDTGASSYTSDNQAQGLWYPGEEAIVLDERVVKRIISNESVSYARSVRTLAEAELLTLRFPTIGRERAKTAHCSTNKAFQDLWDAIAEGGSFLFVPDADAAQDITHWVNRSDEWARDLEVACAPIIGNNYELFEVTLEGVGFTAV